MQMKVRSVGVSLLSVIMLGVTAGPVIAQEKAAQGKMATKVLLDNERVRVTENLYKPGDEGPNVARGYRIVRAMQGGTLQRTYADGRVVTSEWKTGEVRAQGPDPAYIPKNVGKSDFIVYSVSFKEPKKK